MNERQSASVKGVKRSDVVRKAGAPVTQQASPLIQRFHALQQTMGNQAALQLLSQRRRQAPAGQVVQRTIKLHEVNAQVQANAANLIAVKDFLLGEWDRQSDALCASVRKKQGEILSPHAWLADHIGKDYHYDSVDGIETLRQLINDNLREVEKAVRTLKRESQPELDADLRETKIGNEFTFTDDTFKKILGNKKLKTAEEKRKKYYEHFQGVLQRWDGVMAGYGITGTDGVDRFNYGTKRYAFDSIGWYFDVTCDDACVEVVTKATPAKDIESGEVADAIDTYIFGVAKQLGLTTDKVIGGGHINIDREAFGNDSKTLATFLQNFYQDQEYWKQLDPDFYNAPFPNEIDAADKKIKRGDKSDRTKAFESLIGAASQGSGNLSDDELATQLISKAFNTSLVGKTPQDHKHFQAVNLEHYQIADETKKNQQRVEVRRVPAQSNRVELLNELDRLFHLMLSKKPEENRFK